VHVTEYKYDEAGRLYKTIYPDQTYSETFYNEADQVVSTRDANGVVTGYGYDDAGRRTSVTDALSHVTSFGYDNIGNQVTMTDARQNTIQTDYDLLGRQIRTIYPDNTMSATEYDAVGRMKSKTDQAGKKTEYRYTDLGQLATVMDALQQQTSYGYNEVGNRTSQTDALNHTTYFAYDSMGRRISRKLPLGQAENYTYTATENLQTRTDFNRRTTVYDYDAMTRLKSKTPDPFFNASPVTFTYTVTGQRQTMTDLSGTTVYDYDGRNRLTSKQTPQGTLGYTYDNDGNVLSINSSNANGAAMTYAYDGLNRLETMTDNRQLAQSASWARTTYHYDEVGNLADYVYPNTVQTSYHYDALNRLDQMGSNHDTTILSGYGYRLGLAGNRLSVAELSGRTASYGYDDLYRLTSETITGAASGKNGAIGYVYDPVGNRKTRTSTLPGITSTASDFDANDRLISDSYDDNGNTIGSDGILNGYDFENKLIAHGNVTIVYDGDGNRVAKTVNGITTKYLVDTENPTGYAQVLDELTGASVTRTYTFGLDLISQTQITNGTWTPSFYGYDGHGSVRFLTNSSGAVTDTYDYDAFGTLITHTGSTPNNYLFAGEQFDPDLSLYYNRARYLDVCTGRFWGMDTYEGSIAQPLSFHKYTYARGNSVNGKDPSGNFAASLAELEIASTAAITIDLTAILQSLAISGMFYMALHPELETSAADPRATPAQQAEQEVQRRKGRCKSLVYHYTNLTGAVVIFYSNVMIITPGYADRGLPSGAYATDIAPWDSYTQEQLVQILYFNRTNTSRTGYCVVLCNDRTPGFEPIKGYKHQLVNCALESELLVEVDPIAWLKNPMPRK
jgi:RHS repeat-associated protein